MNPAGPEEKRHSRKYVIYFSIGAVLLLVMALLWAVDPSLDYILFGAALFFSSLVFGPGRERRQANVSLSIKMPAAAPHLRMTCVLF